MQKKRMNRDAATPYLDELYAAAREAGAVGGKILGAGGGGYFLFYTPFIKQGRVVDSLLNERGPHPMPSMVGRDEDASQPRRQILPRFHIV